MLRRRGQGVNRESPQIHRWSNIGFAEFPVLIIAITISQVVSVCKPLLMLSGEGAPARHRLEHGCYLELWDVTQSCPGLHPSLSSLSGSGYRLSLSGK